MPSIVIRVRGGLSLSRFVIRVREAGLVRNVGKSAAPG